MNRFRFAVVVAVGLVTSSCVQMMANATNTLQGQNISAAVNKLGFPTDKREMLDHTIYTWKTGNPNAYYCDLELSGRFEEHNYERAMEREQLRL